MIKNLNFNSKKEVKIEKVKKNDIAIVGIDFSFPGASTEEGLWKILSEGRECITTLSKERQKQVREYLCACNADLSNYEAAIGGFLEEIDQFDYSYFKITPKEAELMNPAQCLLLHSVKQLIDKAGYTKEEFKGSSTGVYIGMIADVGIDKYRDCIIKSEGNSKAANAATGNLNSVVCGRVSYFWDLNGPSILVDTACSSSLVALHMACNAIRNGECKQAIVGGVNLDILPVIDGVKVGFESKSNRTRPFSDNADGTVPAEGIVTVLVKSLEDAVENKDNIYAVIKGSAVNQDGFSMGITAPNPRAQAELIEKAWSKVDIKPEKVSYIEAHGTGTILGDPIEIEGIKQAFEKFNVRNQSCAIGSIKGNIGHLYGAAGLASVVKCSLALKHKQIPASINFDVPNSRIDFLNSPLYVNDKLTDWKSKDDDLVCGVSSFGFSGTNCHLIMQNYKEKARNNSVDMIFAVSADTEEEFYDLAASYKEYFKNKDFKYEDVCFTSCIGRNHYKYRAAAVVSSNDELINVIDSLSCAKCDLQNNNKIDRKLYSEYSTENLETICKEYLKGSEVNWRYLYQKVDAHRTLIPAVKLKSENCFVKFSDEIVEKAAKAKKASMFSKTIWVEDEVKEGSLHLADNENVLLVNPVNEDINNLLSSKNTNVIKCNDYDGQLSTILKDEKVDTVVIDRRNYNYSEDSFDLFKDDVRDGLDKVFNILKSYVDLNLKNKLNLIILFNKANKISSEDRILNPLDTSISSFCKSAAKEFNSINFYCIDTDEETSLETCLNSLSDPKENILNGYRKNKKYIEKIVYEEIEETDIDNTSIKDGGVYVVTGGLGGLGLEIAKKISSEYKVKFAFINRSKFPEGKELEEQLKNGASEKLIRQAEGIKFIENNGSTVECFSADMLSLESVSKAFESIRNKYKSINGIFHCAGIAGKGFIKDKDIAEFNKVTRTKIFGTWILNNLTKNDNLDFMVLYSSVAAQLAFPGQSDYTAANSFMDSSAQMESDKGRKVISINWPTWAGVGIAKDNGIVGDTILRKVEIQEGVSLLLCLLNKKVSNVIVGKWIYNEQLSPFININVSDEIADIIYKKEIVQVQDRAHKEVKLEGREDGNYTENEKTVANALGMVLGFKKVNVFDNFYDLGIDSIQSVSLVKQLSELMNCKIGVADVLNNNSISELAKYIEDNYNTSNIVAEEKSIEKLPMNREWYETSSAQKRLYVLNKIEKSSTSYNLPQAFLLSEDMDIVKLENAFNKLIERQESLRTTFAINDGEIIQKIHPFYKLKIDEIETTNHKLNSILKASIKEFDIEKLPLFRVHVFKTEDKRILFFDMHHIIVDGVSKFILTQELIRLYKGEELEELSYQYKDFANFQNKLLDSGLNKEKIYWKEKLSGDITVLNLPVDYKRPNNRTFKGKTLEFKLGSELADNIKKYTISKSCTLFVTMLSAYYTLLYKYTNQEDILVGTPVSGRKYKEFDDVIGMFVNTIVLRNNISGSMKFEDLLNEIKSNSMEAIDNQEYPIDHLIGELNINRNLGRNPLFDTMFSMLKSDTSDMISDAMNLKEFKIYSDVSRFDLTMEVVEEKEDIAVRLEYSTELFKEERIKKLYEHYKKILSTVIFNDSIILNDIDMVSESEKEILLKSFNNTKLEYDNSLCIGKKFEECSDRFKNKVAVEFKDKQITYEDLNKKVNKFARLLMDNGVKTNSRVSLIVSRNEDLLVYILAALKIGAAYIPIDSTYPKERIEYIIENSKTDVVISEKSILSNLGIDKDFKVIDVENMNLDVYEDYNIECEFSAENDAYIIYTSGSTGKPKGVRISHRAVNNLIHGVTDKIDFNSSKSILTLTTISFDIFVLESLLPLCLGMKIVIADENEQLDPNKLGELIVNSDVNMIQMTPSRAHMLVKYCKNKDVLKNVKEVMLGGEAVQLQIINEIKKISNARIYNMYGPTETTVWSSIGELTDKNSIDVGQPIANTRFYVLDEEERLLPVGISGELYIAGDGLCNGYLYRDEMNKERFVNDPFVENQKMYRTGDLANWNYDGTLNILGRLDTQIKVRGYRVELSEIEDAMIEYPGIHEAAATVKTRGDESYIASYYIADNDIQSEKLHNFLAKSLTDYMIPSYFIRLDKLPSTPNGKIDRKRLPDVEQFVIQPKEAVVNSKFINSIEEDIYSIWRDVLKKDDFSINDNFFEIGGTSISLIKLNDEIDKKYPGILEVTDFFEYSTVSKIADYINEEMYGNEEDKDNDYNVNENSENKDIAVIGVSANLPDGLDINRFWKKLCEGTDFVEEVPDNRKNDVLSYLNYANNRWNNIIEYDGFLKGAFLDEIDKFDYKFFNLSPREAELMDPNQRMLLQTVWHTVEDAGYADGSLRGSKTGVYVGFSEDFGISYKRMLEADKNYNDGVAVTGNIRSVIAGRIAYLMDFKGPSIVFDTACSSSLVAIDVAVKDIRSGRCDTAIVGASNIILLPVVTKQKIGIEASDSHAKTFDEASDGTGLGEGVIAVMLKSLNKAVEDNDNIYAVIKGTSVNGDGSSIGLTAPNPKAQMESLISACKDAGIDGKTLDYIEAHGTGTKLGDPIEIEGITKALGKFTDVKQFCGIGSLKTNIGHLDNCAGIAGFLKTVLMLKHKKIPPTLNFNVPNSKINFEKSPVYINDILRDWKRGESPRRCAVNAFGLSGTNCCIILEEAPKINESSVQNEDYIFKLSAKSDKSLLALIDEYINYLEGENNYSLGDICYTADTGRSDYKNRIAFVVRDKNELLDKLKSEYNKLNKKKQ